MRALAFAFIVAFSCGSVQAAPAEIGQREVRSVDAELDRGRQLLQAHDYFNALKQYERANALAGGRSADAFLGMALAARGMKAYANALDFAQSSVAFAGGSPRAIARARKLRGEVYDAMGDQAACEAELRAALLADPDAHVPDLHYELALALLRQHKDEEGLGELRKEIELRPIGTTADEARTILANPRRGREKYAPDFSFTTAEGTTISLASLAGKVVLLDFWSSDCEPCAHALGSLKNVQAAHANQPFLVVSISEDRDRRAWRTFVGTHGMTGPQYWDEDDRMARVFLVEAVPTYILLDGEGIERLRVKETGFNDAKALAVEIDRQLTRLSAPPRP